MKIAKIKPVTIENGPGCRVSVYVSGCRRHCPGCHNAEAWNFDFGEEYNVKVHSKIMELLRPDYITGVTILGGEPLEPENLDGVFDIMLEVRMLYGNAKDIWLYTGYKYEELSQDQFDIAKMADVLVDGAYIAEEADVNLVFCGSRNQRIIDMDKTLAKGEVVEWMKERNAER